MTWNYSIVYSGHFVVWITCLIPEYETVIMAELVKKGYAVSAAAASGQVTLHDKGNASALICLKIETKEEKKASEIHTDIVSVMNDKNYLYYSVVVSILSDSCWCSSNISVGKAPPAPAPPTPDPNRTLN